MALYEFECKSKHVTERFVSLAERPATVKCETCGTPAKFIVSAARTTFHANDRRAIKGKTVNRGVRA